MNQNIFIKLLQYNIDVPIPPKVPNLDNIRFVEKELNFTFPPTFAEYHLKYSHVTVGILELFWLFNDNSYLDMITRVLEAWNTLKLPKHLVPFVEINGDYFCFDINSNGPEYKVIFWDHSNCNTTDEYKDFIDWIDNCWLKEYL